MKKTRYVLLTIIAIDVFFIALNALLIDYINVTYLIIIDVTIWVTMQLVINHYIKKNNGGPSFVPLDQLPEGKK